MVTWTRRRVPHPVYRRLHVGGEGRPPVWDRVGNIDDGLSRDDEPVLVRMQTEDPASAHLGRTVLNNSDGRIAVFDWRGELALLKRTAHAPPFARRDLA